MQNHSALKVHIQCYTGLCFSLRFRTLPTHSKTFWIWSNYLFPFDCWVKGLFAIMEESLKTFPFWELTFESSLSKGLNVLAIFRYVVKSRYLARGRQERNFLLPGLLFERLTFLSKIENRLKRGEVFVWKFHKKRYLWIFKEHLNDGDLWFMPFSLMAS